jgi:hypothetical protein
MTPLDEIDPEANQKWLSGLIYSVVTMGVKRINQVDEVSFK